MKFISILFFNLLLASVSFGQFNTQKETIYSKNAGDSFNIYVSLPQNFNTNNAYKVVYYCDAGLKSGKYLRRLIAGSEFNESLKATIFVGIGHIGNYHVLRRRDFIFPSIKENNIVRGNKNYGQAEKFYSFLKEELVPSINKKFKTYTDSNSIIGHSLGGLFAFYCLFKDDNLFSKYFALSPALWVDNYSIYKFNKIHDGFTNNIYIYFTAGSKEKFNKIVNSTKQAKEFFDTKKYPNLSFEYDIWNGKTHNSEVPYSLQKILKEKL
ncbi:alpha/beta hydrolase [Ferruginibacter albus]|uniref:alpha/beta hydrolase n=1 Tax=Ferruginibacter albus TaxID=2875540 RepID=UPI001CC59423|nr:alpha/beta hydrolase-fold protein [Ferruginibacter albus]UAY51531.1 hypothetical protein K9M53_13160 [Ferruginibacter albus]